MTAERVRLLPPVGQVPPGHAEAQAGYWLGRLIADAVREAVTQVHFEDLLTFDRDETARRLDCDPATVTRLWGNGALAFIYVGANRRTPASALREFIAAGGSRDTGRAAS